MPHDTCAERRLWIEREQAVALVQMSVYLPMSRASVWLWAMPEHEVQLCNAQNLAERAEDRTVHVVRQSVVVALDKDDVSIQALAIRNEIGLAAVAEVADMDDKV